MENSLLILLHYYFLTYWWFVSELLFVILGVYFVRKYKISLKLFPRIIFTFFICVVILVIFGNEVWSKKLLEIDFILISFVAIYSFIKECRKK